MGSTIGSLFFRISKGSHTLKTLLTYKIHQFVKVFLSLTWETNHQCSTDMNSWHTLTDSLQEIYCLLLGHMTVHTGKHVITDMLQRYIKILADICFLAHHIEQIHRELIRISIMQSNPFHAWNISHFADKLCDMMLAIKVNTIIG